MNATEQKGTLKLNHSFGMGCSKTNPLPAFRLTIRNANDDTVIAEKDFAISKKNLKIIKKLDEDKDALEIIDNAVSASLTVELDCIEKFLDETQLLDKEGKTRQKKELNKAKTQQQINSFLAHCSKHTQRAIWITLNVEANTDNQETLLEKVKRFLYRGFFQMQLNF